MNWQQLLIALGFLVAVGGVFWAALARSRVARAVFARNVSSYFSGVLGYLFIVVFVLAAGFLAFRQQFFTNNLANLDPLSEWFPMLLLFLVPAITMTVWSDERKLGTDELLFTLPGSDVEILLGKYLAVLAVYTIALAFSMTLWIWLAWIGDPDWGLIFTTYVGYWLAGAALLAAGMFASVLTSSATVAFVLGAAICAVPVFIDYAWPSSDFLRSLSIREQIRDFTMGMLPLTGILYFVSLTVFMLYLNLVFISKRHWSASRQTDMGTQFAVRSLALAVFLIGLNAMAVQANTRADMTAEWVYSLAPTTQAVLDKVSEKRPVTIQAFVSPDVPRDYVPVRKRLIGLLREYDRLGGPRVEVRLVDVEPYSKQAEEARAFGITPVQLVSERDGRRIQEDVFLGAVVTSPYDEVVVPFFGAGTPIEYELTRSIGTVSGEKRLRIGVLQTDAQVMSGSSEWQIVTELKKQYEVEEVSPDSAIDGEKYDVLIAVLPSSLTQPQMNNLVEYVRKGNPTLIFDDPFPLIFSSRFGVTNAPRQEKPRPGGMMGMMGGPPPQPKADGGRASSLLNVLDLAWDNGEVVWDSFNPHPEFALVVPQEYLFISPQSGVRNAFSPKSPITSGLQEVFLAYAGTVRPRSASELKFEPLMRTTANSGLLDWDEFTEDSFDPTRMAPTRRLKSNPPYESDEFGHVVAYHVTSPKKDGVEAVYVADIDMISDVFFHQRERAEWNLDLDNVTFVLNAVDVLAGEENYLDLRKRRSEHRTLRAVEARTAKYVKERNERQQQADKEADKKLEAAKERFAEQRKAIEEDKTLDDRTRQIMLQNIQATEQRRLDVDQANIEREKQQQIDQAKAETERDIAATIGQIKWLAILTLPIPAILLGIGMFAWRWSDERRDVAPLRRVRDRAA